MRYFSNDMGIQLECVRGFAVLTRECDEANDADFTEMAEAGAVDLMLLALAKFRSGASVCVGYEIQDIRCREHK